MDADETSGTRPDPAAPEREAEAMLGRYTDAMVAAVDASGLFVPVPPVIPLDGQVVMTGRSLLDHVLPADMATVVAAWTEAVATGSARCTVRLVNEASRPMQVHFGDFRPVWGVFLCMVAPEDDDEQASRGPVSTEIMRPRTATLHYDGLAHAIWCDDQAPKMLGWPREQILGNQATSILHPEDQPRAITAWMEMLASRRPHQFRARRLRGNGEWLWIEFTIQNCLDLGDQDHVNVDIVDISEEMAALDALRAHEELLDRIAKTIPIGLLEIDRDGDVVYTNDQLHRILGTGAEDRIDHILGTVHPEDRTRFDDALGRVLASEAEPDLEARLVDGDADDRRVAISLRPLHGADGGVSGAIACLWDITRSARLRQELEWRATFDPLTGCHNRASLMAALERAVADPPPEGLAVIFLDLDRFKPVNDELGHHTGDELLRVVADRIRSAVRDGDIVGRIGGDEFLVLCRGLQEPADAMDVARRVTAVTNVARLTIGASPIELSTSIGVAWWKPGVDADALVRAADAAMYESKREGLGRPVLHGLVHPDRGRGEPPTDRW